MKHNNYNGIAWCYDLLSRLIFGNAIRKAQTEVLSFIPARAKVLIAGGGTGWILEEISKICPPGLSVTYIDASDEMIKRSKKRDKGLNAIKFVNEPIEQVNTGFEMYDVIITPFFFDNFSQPKCGLVFQQLHAGLKKEGIWLYTDFELSKNKKYWQKPILSIMYVFFKIVCRLEAGRLPDVNHLFLTTGYKKIAEKLYYKNFIVSRVLKSSSKISGKLK